MISNQGGIVVKSVPKSDDLRLWYNNGSYHLLTVGTTGSGKTQNIVMPSILSIATSGASMVINDPKGELYSLTSEYLKRSGYKVYAMDYFQPLAGTCFNQLFMINQEYDRGLRSYYTIHAIGAILKVMDLIEGILTKDKNKNRLMYFQETRKKGKHNNLAPRYQQHIAKGRFYETGNTAQRETVFVYPELDINNESKFTESIYKGDLYRLNLEKLHYAFTNKYKLTYEEYSNNTETIVKMLKEIFCNLLNFISQNYETPRNDDNYDTIHHNDYLLARQDKIIKRVREVLDLMDPLFIHKYYENKIIQNMEILKDRAPGSPDFALAEEFIERYRSILLQPELSLETLRTFLNDMLADHQSIWRSCETEANKNAKIVAQMIVGKTGSEKIWDDSAVALIQALILLTCREADLDCSRHLGSVNRILSELIELDEFNKTGIDYISDRLEYGDIVRTTLAGFRSTSDKTKTSVLFSANTPVGIFGDYAVIDQAAHHEFDPETLAEEKTAVFLISPGNDDAGSAQYTILSTLFVEQVFTCLNRYLNKTKEQTLPRPVYFLLDEVANIPPIPQLGSKITLARSKNMRFLLVIQSYEQLKNLYHDECETIKENSQLMYLLSNSLGTASEISERIGKATTEINSWSSSTNDSGTSYSTNTSATGSDLITAQELMTLKEGEGVYIMTRQSPYRTSLLPAYKWKIYGWMKNHRIENIHIKRNEQEVNFFCPDIEDFTTAYECLAKGFILDYPLYMMFKNMEIQDGTKIEW